MANDLASGLCVRKVEGPEVVVLLLVSTDNVKIQVPVDFDSARLAKWEHA